MTDAGVARAAVLGMVAGAVGAVAMTITQRVEMSLWGRAPSTVPGQVGAHLVPGADPAVPGDVARLNGPVHWGHGIAMGALRGSSTSRGCTVRQPPPPTSRSSGAGTPPCTGRWG